MHTARGDNRNCSFLARIALSDNSHSFFGLRRFPRSSVDLDAASATAAGDNRQLSLIYFPRLAALLFSLSVLFALLAVSDFTDLLSIVFL